MEKGFGARIGMVVNRQKSLLYQDKMRRAKAEKKEEEAELIRI